MSAKINKNGKEYDLGFMPQHYPADRVYLDGDTSKTVQDAIDEVEGEVDSKVSKTGDTMSGNLQVDRQDGTVSEYGKSYLIAGNNIAEGTAKNSRGILRLYDLGTRFANLVADTLTANRTLTLPNKTGTLQANNTISDLEEVLRPHIGITPSSSGKSTLLAYIHDVVIPQGSFIYAFTAESFNDLPENNWGYDVIVFQIGGVFAIANRQQSEGVTYVRNINASSQWVGNWKQL